MNELATMFSDEIRQLPGRKVDIDADELSRETIVKIIEIKRRNRREVSSIAWELIKMSKQEEDLVYRMYKIVGDRWALIAGRIPGRKAEEIERFWLMRHMMTTAP
ncbi:MYB-like transcription factor ETC1 [Cornus florida]|uniref:MYB-like transcription factor ETC1 n=1 Tax=Cornus florida TaxID=4283 RepID=UPI00289CBE67|nr:MYB-like transcription factor ETC1 [Cornus florida]